MSNKSHNFCFQRLEEPKYKSIKLDKDDFNMIMSFMTMSHIYMMNMSKELHPDQWDEANMDFYLERWEYIKEKLNKTPWLKYNE